MQRKAAKAAAHRRTKCASSTLSLRSALNGHPLDAQRPSRLRGRGVEVGLPTLFCHGDEENGHRACTNGHLTTADQSEIRKAYLALLDRSVL